MKTKVKAKAKKLTPFKQNQTIIIRRAPEALAFLVNRTAKVISIANDGAYSLQVNAGGLLVVCPKTLEAKVFKLVRQRVTVQTITLV